MTLKDLIYKTFLPDLQNNIDTLQKFDKKKQLTGVIDSLKRTQDFIKNQNDETKENVGTTAQNSNTIDTAQISNNRETAQLSKN
jgi:hypothetical protein